MNNFWGKNRNFVAIIIGAVIIGGFIYTEINKPEKFSIVSAPKIEPAVSAQNVVQNLKINTSIQSSSVVSCGAESQTIVTKVIDGDTVVVEGGYHVRLLGMDADEKDYPCYEPAKVRLENLVLGKSVVLEKDKTDVDQYGRCLRYVIVGNINVDVQLVKEGLAVARFYAPDVKYKTEIVEAEKQAQISEIGCKWGGAK